LLCTLAANNGKRACNTINTADSQSNSKKPRHRNNIDVSYYNKKTKKTHRNKKQTFINIYKRLVYRLGTVSDKCLLWFKPALNLSLKPIVPYKTNSENTLLIPASDLCNLKTDYRDLCRAPVFRHYSCLKPCNHV